MFRHLFLFLASALLLWCPFAGTSALAQSKSPSPDEVLHAELAAQLEEIAMCHHAIRAAHHEAIRLGQNPFFRYIINSPRAGSNENIYPIPERCEHFESKWVMDYTTMDAAGKVDLDKIFSNAIGMTIADIAADAQFLTKVIFYKGTDNWNKLDAPDAIQ